VADTFTLTPPKIEEYFGITRGHIHHIENSFGFSDRFPYATSIEVRPCLLLGSWAPWLPLPQVSGKIT
jgi:hypothetical protein